MEYNTTIYEIANRVSTYSPLS